MERGEGSGGKGWREKERERLASVSILKNNLGYGESVKRM